MHFFISRNMDQSRFTSEVYSSVELIIRVFLGLRVKLEV